MNGKPEIDEARTCKPQILMISPKFFMTEVCKMMIRSHRTNKVLIKNSATGDKPFSKLSMTLLLIKLDLVFRRCRFVTQIGDFSYVKLQHECSSFSLTLKMRQNYILDEAKDGQINFAVLTVPSHCRIKILLFRNHWSERGRFATPQMYVIFSTALISKGNTWKTSAKEVRNVIIWIGWNSWWIVYFWESATHVTGKRRRFFIFNHIHKRGGTSHKISVMSRAELGGHWASPSRAFYKLFLCYTNEPTSRAKTVPSHEFSLVTSQVVT